jgi:DNA primase
MNSLEIIIEALERHGSKVRRHSTAIVAQCPSHKDNTPSLALKHADDRTLLNCFAGCDTNIILETIGLTIKDSFDEPIETMAPVVNMADYLLKQIQTDEPIIENKPIPNVTEYVYHNEQWEPVAKTIKIVTPDGKKTFRQHRYDNGQWEPGLNGLTPPLYELPAVIDAINDGLPIYVCEGEKDADTINNIKGLQAVATTAPMGAGKWRQQHTEQLTGAKLVYIIHDNDEPGINHAINVQTQLNDHNIPTIILTPKTGKDATDHINAGHGINDFIDANQQIQDAKN